MKLSELIKQLQEIDEEYRDRRVEVIIVNDYLVIREILEDSDHYYSERLITSIEFE
jgi:hypothetical protein